MLFLAGLVGMFYLTVLVARPLIGVQDETDGAAPHDFPDSFAVSEGNDLLRIAHSTALEPEDNKDFLIWSVFMLRKPLELGERAVFLGKYETDEKSRPGYALGLIRLQDGVHPIVYWQDKQSVGRWFTFSVGEFPARTWLLAALSFRNGTVLGIHGGPLDAVNVLGGYHLEKGTIPHSTADLQAGAIGGGKFRGRFGAIGILQTENLTDAIVPILDQLRTRPDEFPSFAAGADSVKLWLRGVTDQSALRHTVEVRGRRTDDGQRHAQ